VATESDFRLLLSERIRSYRTHEARIQSHLDEVTGELGSVTARRKAAEELYRTEFGEEPLADETEAPTREVQVGHLTGLSWAEAITRVLVEAGEPLHVKEIWRQLQEGGFRTDSRDPVRSLVAIAVRNPKTFTKAAPNTYTVSPRDAALRLDEGGEAKGLF
jgi:hypothetical protein